MSANERCSNVPLRFLCNACVWCQSLLDRHQNRKHIFEWTVLLRHWEFGVVDGTRMTALSSTFASFCLFFVHKRSCFLFFRKTARLWVQKRTFSVCHFEWRVAKCWKIQWLWSGTLLQSSRSENMKGNGPIMKILGLAQAQPLNLAVISSLTADF